jgi:hypothetical protein
VQTFYLGIHHPRWLREVSVPTFVSRRALMRMKQLPAAAHRWALDSGGFTELSMFGEWRTTPEAYVADVRRYRDEIGRLEWAAPQDWRVEPFLLERTGLTVAEHQKRTVENYLLLRDLDPALPFIPVLQGQRPEDYERHADDYEAAGVELAREPLVGIGSVCRRQRMAEGVEIVHRLSLRGIRLHGFGVKLTGLREAAHWLTSADSMAWSYEARRGLRASAVCELSALGACMAREGTREYRRTEAGKAGARMKNDEPRIAPERRHLLACDAIIQIPPTDHVIDFNLTEHEKAVGWTLKCRRCGLRMFDMHDGGYWTLCSGKDTPCAP